MTNTCDNTLKQWIQAPTQLLFVCGTGNTIRFKNANDEEIFQGISPFSIKVPMNLYIWMEYLDAILSEIRLSFSQLNWSMYQYANMFHNPISFPVTVQLQAQSRGPLENQTQTHSRSKADSHNTTKGALLKY